MPFGTPALLNECKQLINNGARPEAGQLAKQPTCPSLAGLAQWMYPRPMHQDSSTTSVASNQLEKAPSSYLRSARHQPVQWHPWGEAAFARAQAEDKPILLDIGAVWCHWCHVMDRESYEDPEM